MTANHPGNGTRFNRPRSVPSIYQCFATASDLLSDAPGLFLSPFGLKLNGPVIPIGNSSVPGYWESAGQQRLPPHRKALRKFGGYECWANVADAWAGASGFLGMWSSDPDPLEPSTKSLMSRVNTFPI